MNSRLLTFLVIPLLLSVCPTQIGQGEPSQQVAVGPRAIAMGGAYTSVVDDISAIYWNPAGLIRIGHQEIAGTHANLYDSGIKDSYVAFALPLTERHAVAVDWYHSGFDDGELGFGENRFDVSYGVRLHPLASLGLSLKHLTRNFELDGSTVRRGSGSGADFGVLLTPMKSLRLGIIAQDVFDTKVEYDDGNAAVAFPRNIRLGTSYDPHRMVTVAFDLDDRYHLGTEIRPFDQAALRAGLERDRQDGEDAFTYTVGAGFRVGIFRIDYAYVIPPFLSATNHVGLSLAFNFNPSQIRIEKVEIDDVFASLYKTYAQAPIGKARIRNLQDNPLPAKITVFVAGSMNAPTEQQVILRPRATQEIPLNAVFTEEILKDAGDRPVQVQVAATYQSQRLPRTEKKATRCVIYGSGAIDWGKGVEQAGAFVTTKDPSVDALARGAVRSAVVSGQDPFGTRNIRHAAALFDALGVLGVTYVPDPQNPYSAMSETARAVDTIHYPRETLLRRTGDCDDTSVLMAALLMNVGIPTKLVDVPGHVFVLADAGVHARNSLALGLDESLYVVVGDEIWIPIETTALGRGFTEGWRTGAEEYQTWASRGRLNLVDVAEAQSRYPPRDFLGEAITVAALDTTQTRAWIMHDGGTVGSWREQYLAERYREVQGNLTPTPRAVSQLARVYFLASRLEESRVKLEEILRRDPRSAMALNNLGNIDAVTGKMGRAADRFASALVSDRGDAGIWLNLGLTRYSMGDTVAANEAITEGLARSGGFEPSCRLLGLDVTPGPTREDSERLTAEEARLLLQKALAQIQTIPAETDTTRTERSEGGPNLTKPMQMRIAASRAAERMSLKDHLYWKD